MKVKIYAYWQQYDWEDKPDLQFSAYDMSDVQSKSCARSPAGVFELDLPIVESDRTDLVKHRVASLRAEQGTLQAQMTVIDRKINELLAIEYKAEAA